jgi:hypothetical protein
MKGVAKFCVDPTSLLLNTPAAVATNPFTRVARPIIVDKSAEGRPIDDAEDINHDSNAENNIEVEMPPRSRPTRRTGSTGKRMRMQVKVYVMQNAKQSFRRPLNGNR